MTKHHENHPVEDVEQESAPPIRKAKHHTYKTAIIITAVIVLAVLGALAWLYSGNLNDSKSKVFSKLPLPAALIESKLLPARELINRIELAKKIPSDQRPDEATIRTQIFDQLIDAKKLEVIASNNNVKAEAEQIDSEYKNIINQYAAGNDAKFSEELMNTYGLSPEQFKSDVIRLDILQSNMALWFNQQESLNPEAYKTAKDLQNRLQNGEEFETVASAYTEDEATKDFAGDAGFVSVSDLLPEFQSQLKDAQLNDVKLIVSRYGLHIFKLLEKDNNGENGEEQLHLQQIFIKPNDFQAWYQKQSDELSVKRFLKV